MYKLHRFSPEINSDAEVRMRNERYDVLDNPGEEIRHPFIALTELNAQPYLARICLPATDLIWELRSDLWGLFRLLVQSGRAMKFSGTAGVVGGDADGRNRH